MQAHTPQASSYGASVLALSPDQQPARYRPWEQKDLLNRLKTFRPRSWFGRPLQVNAISCARHGWINSGPDTLKCEVPNKHVITSASSRSDQGSKHMLLQFCGECMDLPIRPRWSAQQVQKVGQKSTSQLNQHQYPVSIAQYACRLLMSTQADLSQDMLPHAPGVTQCVMQSLASFRSCQHGMSMLTLSSAMRAWTGFHTCRHSVSRL